MTDPAVKVTFTDQELVDEIKANLAALRTSVIRAYGHGLEIAFHNPDGGVEISSYQLRKQINVKGLRTIR